MLHMCAILVIFSITDEGFKILSPFKKHGLHTNLFPKTFQDVNFLHLKSVSAAQQPFPEV